MTNIIHQPGESEFFSAADMRFRTQVGKRIGNEIHSSGTAGCLMYGPYIKMVAGSYSIKVSGKFVSNEHGKAEIEITSDCGEFVLAHGQLVKNQDSDYISELSFSADTPCNAVEIRIHADSISDTRIFGISITRLRAPDANARKKETIFSNGETLAELTSVNSDTVVVTFQPYGFSGFDRRGFAEDFIPSIGYDVVCFKPRRDAWYQDISADDVRSQVAPILKKYKRRVVYGSSMGGYAALYFSAAIDAHAAVAISPQYSVDRSIVPFEDRWKAESDSIGFTHRWEGTNPMTAHLIYDPADKGDKEHFSQLRARFPAGENFALPFSGHPSTTALSESRQLKGLVRSLINGEPASARQVQERIRSTCAFTYAHLLIARAANRKAPLAIRLFSALSARHAGNTKWLNDTAISLGRRYAKDKRLLYAFSVAAAFVKATNPAAAAADLCIVNFVRSALPKDLQCNLDAWIKDWHEIYPSSDARISTRIGNKTADGIVASSAGGTLAYGPYAHLPAGRFLATVKGKTNGSNLLIRVTAGCGSVELSRRCVELRQGDFCEIVECSSETDCSNTEIIVEVEENSDVVITSIGIQVLEIDARSIECLELPL